MMKVCGTCRVEQPLENFHADKGKKDGKSARCRQCSREHWMKWCAENPGRNEANQLRWRRSNAEHCRNYGRTQAKKWRAENPEKHLANQAAWREKNREKLRAQKRARYHQDPIKALADHKMWRLMKRNGCPRWLSRDQKSEILKMYRTSSELSKITGIEHHVDHIIPLKGANVSGLHVPWNLRVIPGSLNASKTNKLPSEDQWLAPR